MFGHKGGRIERELQIIKDEVEGTMQFFQREITDPQLSKILFSTNVMTNHKKTIKRIDNLIALSCQIHDLIDKEL